MDYILISFTDLNENREMRGKAFSQIQISESDYCHIKFSNLKLKFTKLAHRNGCTIEENILGKREVTFE